ncbi:helix-turn-helix domain-containing protein [Eubacteriales bacterium OttesenSCG-928-A19]|nr:helix-turn-helix domain-containing protein [Eubacteriales bacterium OttesenSCG-928-A19]
MKINIGATIAGLRHARGVTQEQLAAAVGVSAPAVSKWETGQSYPDITLLPPLARFFDTSVDALLAFEPVLTEEGVDECCDRVRDTFARDGWDAGLACCDALLHEHPTDMRLRMALSGVLMEGMLYAPDDAAREVGRARQICLLQEASSATEGETQLMARNLLGVFYMNARRLDEAEVIFQDLLDLELNTRQFMPTLRLLQGRAEEAMKLAQRNLLLSASEASNALLTMTSLAMKLDNPDAAARYAEAADTMATLLGLSASGMSLSAAQARLLVAEGQGSDALMDAIERYIRVMLTDPALPQSAFFDRLQSSAPQEATHAERQSATSRQLADGLEQDERYASLREHPRFQTLLASLREGAGEGTLLSFSKKRK